MLQQLYQLHDILQKIPQEDEKIFVSIKILANFPDNRTGPKSTNQSEHPEQQVPDISVMYGEVHKI